MKNGVDRTRCPSCAIRTCASTLVISLAFAVFKVLVGWMAGSHAVTAAALYSLNDVLSASVVIVSLRLGGRPADADHPYGHGKIEFLAVAGVSVVLVVGVVFIIVHSLSAVGSGVEGPPHPIAISVAALSIGVNRFLASRTDCAARSVGSPVLHMGAEHLRADAVSSSVVLVGLVGTMLGIHALDPLVALYEVIDVVILSGKFLGRAVAGLMDSALPLRDVEAIRHACAGVEGVESVVDVRTRQGGTRSWADVSVALSGELPVEQAHAVAERVRAAVQEASGRTMDTHVRFTAERDAAPPEARDADA